MISHNTSQNVIITILDIIHRPAFYLKHDVSETEWCIRLQVKSTQLGPIGTEDSLPKTNMAEP
jgi:hypothetical protein